MLAKSLLSIVLSLTLPLLAVCGTNYDNCITAGVNECLKKYSGMPDRLQRSELMDTCIVDLILPENQCFTFR